MIKRQTSNRFFVLFLALVSFSFIHSVGAKDIYGYMTGNANLTEMPTGVYKFDTADGDALEMQYQLTMQLWGGAYAEGYLYMIFSDDGMGYIPSGLCQYDILTKTPRIGYAYQTYQCSDMTYDYSTKTMYGIMVKNGGEDVQHQLIKIDLNNGNRTKVADLKDKVAAIACNYFGDLYVMSTRSKLYEMDKQTGDMTLIGETGVEATAEQAQSMEFDRETGELYWTGLDINNSTFLNKIDPYTGSVKESIKIKNNALIAALHIPFNIAADEAPAKVENLNVTVNDKNVTLKWRNPSKTYGGKDLSSPITKIEICCNGKTVKTIEGVTEPDAEQEWVDDIPDGENSKRRYIIYAYNEAGRGEPASCIAMTGEDIPEQVSDLTVVNDGANVKLTWKAPSKGKNGGMLKAENLRYSVTRYPEGKEFDGITETEFTDNTLQAATYCNYQVVCYNGQGQSDAVTTDLLSAGGSIVPPYHADFANSQHVAQWKVVNANNDNSTWTYNSGEGAFTCYTYGGNVSDDSLVSVPFALKKDVRYIVKYKIKATDMFGTSENFRLSVKNDQKEVTLEELQSFNTGKDGESRSVEFTADADGEYKFVMSALSKAEQWCIEISGFSVDPVTARDLAVTSIEGYEFLTEKKKETYKISVANRGTETIEGFRVILSDQHGQILAQSEAAGAIAAGQTEIIDMSWTPASTDITAVTATVETSGDEIPENNSVTKDVTVIPEDEKYIEMGGKESSPTIIPFGFEGYLYSYSQAIYRTEDTGGKPGEISELQYDYVNNGNAMSGKHVKIYMSNVDYGDIDLKWLTETEMSLVFDGEVSFIQGAGVMRIIFDKPFKYTGGNLCVMCQKHNDSEIGNVKFFAKNYGNEARTTVYWGDDPTVDASEITRSAMLSHVRMRFKETASSGLHSAFVTDKGILVHDGRIELDGQPANISVTDMSGKVVAKASNASSLDISKLQGGVYIVKAETEGVSVVRKFIVK